MLRADKTEKIRREVRDSSRCSFRFNFDSGENWDFLFRFNFKYVHNPSGPNVFVHISFEISFLTHFFRFRRCPTDHNTVHK